MTAIRPEYWEYIRRGCLFPLYWDHGPAWTRAADDIYGCRGENAVAYFSGDAVFFRVCRNETRRAGAVFVERMLGDAEYRGCIFALWREIAVALRHWIATCDPDKADPHRIVEEMLRPFGDLHRKAQAVWTAKEFFDAVLTDTVGNAHSGGGLPRSFSMDEADSLASLAAEARRMNLVQGCSNARDLMARLRFRGPSLAQAIMRHVEKYFWTGATYAEVMSRDELYVCHEILVSTGGPVAAPVLARPSPPVGIEALHNDFAPLFEERREVLMRCLFHVDRLYRILGTRFGLHGAQAKWLTLDEWLAVLDGAALPVEDLADRMSSSFVTWRNGECHWLTGEPAFEAERQFRNEWFPVRGTRLHGDAVVPTNLTGSAWVVTGDFASLPPADGAWVLVTGMSTPDMTPLLPHIAAVVTDEGGLTSHAATVCREMGLPCLINTRLGTKLFRTGDSLRLHGQTVELVSRATRPQVAPGPRTLPPRARPAGCPLVLAARAVRLGGREEVGTATVGAKAARLHQGLALGLPVPPAIAIIPERQDRGVSLDALLSTAAVEGFLTAHSRFAVRSSAVGEDEDTASLAGHYTSFLSVPRERLAEVIEQCAQIMEEKGATQYSVVVQAMVEATASGVAFYPNLASGRTDQVLVEAQEGPGGVVSGGGVPQRYVCRVGTHHLERVDIFPVQEPQRDDVGFVRPSARRALLTPRGLDTLLSVVADAAGLFAFPLDVEWAQDSLGQPILLQFRPIVTSPAPPLS